MNILAAVILTLLVALYGGCQKGGTVPPPIDVKANSVWKHNMVVFEGALNKNREGDDFNSACGFFWHLTGINLHLNYSTVGILPTAETSADLARIKLWYRANKTRLYWDEASGIVKVRPVKDSRGDAISVLLESSLSHQVRGTLRNFRVETWGGV